ncbi:uncharacterized protein MJAP1_000746 [Malassezia japonica]|uniref:Prefoldin subunit 4 n=1 Tax=Malassezia japonica TaxID=223818 RepID=A0AAF0J9J0_9BASI|nr:uncharacterized protein MJAP1_000746 [Malassezia japonica]WFD37799.1 hypothetical protein MJAP1_000746 [Malassezia japonica]
MRMLDEKSNNDVEVSWEDQQRINRFSRLHATFSDVEEELKARRTEREELDDLGMELELLEDERILYKVGDAYISMAQEDAVTQLEQDTQRADKELARLQKVMDECESGMNELKVALYAKFGSNINLEN